MFIDIIRAVVERVMRDKILLALVIIVILGVFFTGASKGPAGRFVSNEAREGQEPAEDEENKPEQKHQEQAQKPGQPQPQGQGQGQTQGQPGGQAQGQTQPQEQAGKLTPSLACDFVKWWLQQAMDYSLSTGKARHEEAMKWMLPPAAEAFKAQFWSDVVAQGVAQGAMTGAYQSSEISALALNPDGTVAVKAVGALVTQQAGFAPQTQSLNLQFLIGKTPSGVGILNFYAEPGQIVSQGQQPAGQAQMVGPAQETQGQFQESSQAQPQPGERRQAWPRDY